MARKTDEPNQKAKGVSRRGLIGRIGATGLMASAGVFAGTAMTAKPAAAAPLCCNLANYPANTTYANCYANAAYIWYCSENAHLHCSCCETAGNALSAADCRYN
jgi:hypothetical protein